MLFFLPMVRHLEIFELVRLEDERELATRLEAVSFSAHCINNNLAKALRSMKGCGLEIVPLQ